MSTTIKGASAQADPGVRLAATPRVTPGQSRSLPASLFPTMTGLADEFAFADPDERFELLIDIFVDGLARRAAAASP